ncbi:MAG: rhamnogalacturonan acetylesterase [Luteolibacter sp.]
MKLLYCIATLALSAFAALADLPTLWIVGDSTVHNTGKSGELELKGWGDEIPAFFDPAKIKVVNKAIGGRSSLTFLTEKRWDEVLAGIKPGDRVLIQFGHNDVGSPGEKSRYRGTLKGTGEETRDVTKADGTTEAVHTYGWYLRNYITTAKAKGAVVTVCAPIPHKKWENGVFSPDFVDYGTWARESAETAGATFIDLTNIIRAAYQKDGEETVAGYYADERTHTSIAGAKRNAGCVIAGLKALPGAPFDAWLSLEGKGIEVWKP